MKVLIDTNVILDFLIAREPFAPAAKEIITLAEKGKIEAFLTASSVTDIFYILRKYTDREKAKEVLSQLFEIVDVVEVTKGDIKKALNLNLKDFEDALQVCCGKKKKVNYIVTRNEKDFRNSPVKIISPAELIKLLKS